MLPVQAHEAAEAMEAELRAATDGVEGEALPAIAAFTDFAGKARRKQLSGRDRDEKLARRRAK